MEDVYMVKNDLKPDIQATLRYLDGTPVNLAGCTVGFYMTDDDGVSKISNGSCTIVDAPNGVVKYVWQTGQTATVGVYHAEFKVTDAQAKVQTFPQEDELVIRIRESN